jgi:hypothetical protein
MNLQASSTETPQPRTRHAAHPYSRDVKKNVARLSILERQTLLLLVVRVERVRVGRADVVQDVVRKKAFKRGHSPMDEHRPFPDPFPNVSHLLVNRDLEANL